MEILLFSLQLNLCIFNTGLIQFLNLTTTSFSTSEKKVPERDPNV